MPNHCVNMSNFNIEYHHAEFGFTPQYPILECGKTTKCRYAASNSAQQADIIELTIADTAAASGQDATPCIQFKSGCHDRGATSTASTAVDYYSADF